jgi:tetratricopeptide (TPR) repeat protein
MTKSGLLRIPVLSEMSLTFALLSAAGGPLRAGFPAQSPVGLLTKAANLEKAGDHGGAEAAYRQALVAAPDDPELLKALGVVCQEQGKFDESIGYFQQILKRAPVYPGINALLGVSYYGLNHFDRTIDASRQELVANPKDSLARYYLALALTAKGNLFEAIQQLEAVAGEDPQNLAVRYQLVVDYKAAMRQAAEHLTRMAPDSDFTHAMKAESLADDNRMDDAILEFQEVLRKNPAFPGIHFGLGEVYWRKKDNANALEQLRLALLEEPNQPLANYYMGDVLVDQQKFRDAIPHLKVAVAVYPELPQARFLLGKSYAGIGDSATALREFDKALELDPDYKEVHFQLYELYARRGDAGESQKHLRISERLTQAGQDRDRAKLLESLEKQKHAADKP